MNPLPNAAALGLGCLIGLLVFGPVRRWLLTLRHTLRDRAARDAVARDNSAALLLIFATLHPAPWLLLMGLPYGIYRMWLDPPLRAMWACLMAGALLACVLAARHEAHARRTGGPMTRSRATVRT